MHSKVLKSLTLIGVATLCVVLSACAHHQEPPQEQAVAIPDTMNMLWIGRAISGNAVDIYDPNVTSFNIPGITQPPKGIHYPRMAKHPSLLIRDNSVEVYSMDMLTAHMRPPEDSAYPVF